MKSDPIINQLYLIKLMTEKDYVQIQAVAKCRIIMEILTRIQADATEVIDPQEYNQVQQTITKWAQALNKEIKKITIKDADPPTTT